MSTFITARESIERIKDIISIDIQGCVFDYHVAEALDMDYGTLRIAKQKNNIPIREIAKFCYDKKLIINDLLFDNDSKKII